MQAVEALQRILMIAERHKADWGSDIEADLVSEDTQARQEAEQDEIAVSILYAMLNTALPVARYRVFVEIIGIQPKRTAFQQSVAVQDEFTICSVDMLGVIAGLIGVSHVPHHVRVTVFEQRQTGADMLSGYTGNTKGDVKWKRFLESLPHLETMPKTENGMPTVQ